MYTLVHIYTFTHMIVYIYVYTYIHIYVYTHVYISTCIQVFKYACLHTYAHTIYICNWPCIPSKDGNDGDHMQRFNRTLSGLTQALVQAATACAGWGSSTLWLDPVQSTVAVGTRKSRQAQSAQVEATWANVSA